MHFPWNQKFKVKLHTFDRKKSKSKFTPKPRDIRIKTLLCKTFEYKLI